MAHLFATLTSCVLKLLCFILLFIMVIIFFIIVFFALMFGELASGLVLASLSATPPHLTSVGGLMGPATPVKVLLLMELLVAGTAHFDAQVNLAFPILELDNSKLHFFALSLHVFDGFFS